MVETKRRIGGEASTSSSPPSHQLQVNEVGQWLAHAAGAERLEQRSDAGDLGVGQLAGEVRDSICVGVRQNSLDFFRRAVAAQLTHSERNIQEAVMLEPGRGVTMADGAVQAGGAP